MDNREVLLRVENLCQHFGKVKAVDDVTFDIYKGEVFGLVGESGCGKTTTGRSIIKIYDITSGSISFKGERIAIAPKTYREELAAYEKENTPESKEKAKKLKADWKRIKKTGMVTDIQMIFQDPIASLNPRMTVKEIVSEGLVIQGEKDPKVIEEKVYKILELVGLVREHAGRYPHEFSGGQRQRIGIARSVIMHPELLIADEPISALDVSIQAQVINLLNELRETLDLTILFIAHDLSVVKYFSDRIGVMYFGKLVELAPADELFDHPLHPYTKSLLSAIPLPDPHREKQRNRIAYNPDVHDYSVDKPTMREVAPGHFVYCNDAEALSYQKELG